MINTASSLKAYVGTSEYYKKRHADFEARHPDLEAPDYYLGYGDRYMHRFVDELGPSMSKSGKMWLLKTRAALQKSIEDRRNQDPVSFDALEQNPSAFREFCYSVHPDCYIKSGLGRLNPVEWTQIILTPDTKDLLNGPGVRQMVDTTGLLLAERARKDLAKVRRHAPKVADALDQVGQRVGPVVDQALLKSTEVLKPLTPLAAGLVSGAEKLVLACCPVMEPIRQSVWTSLNHLVGPGHQSRVGHNHSPSESDQSRQ